MMCPKSVNEVPRTEVGCPNSDPSVFSEIGTKDLPSLSPSPKHCFMFWSSCSCGWSPGELSWGQIGWAYRMEWQVSKEMRWKVKPSMAAWGGILPESRILSSGSKWQNDSISLCLSASGSVPLAGTCSGCVAHSLSCFGFLKVLQTLPNPCQRAGPATQLQY